MSIHTGFFVLWKFFIACFFQRERFIKNENKSNAVLFCYDKWRGGYIYWYLKRWRFLEPEAEPVVLILFGAGAGPKMSGSTGKYYLVNVDWYTTIRSLFSESAFPPVWTQNIVLNTQKHILKAQLWGCKCNLNAHLTAFQLTIFVDF